MNYTKENIDVLVKKILKDISRPYFTNKSFSIELVNNEFIYDTKQTIEKCWNVVVYVQEDQFPDKEEYGVLLIRIDDNTGEIVSYLDFSCGRPIPMKAVLKKDKYQLMVI